MLTWSQTFGRLRDSIVAKTARKSWLLRRQGGRNKVGCIILGRGEDDKKVREWLMKAAGVPGFIGFAVGRTISGSRSLTGGPEDDARRRCGRNCPPLSEFVDIFESAPIKTALLNGRNATEWNSMS